jgi:hypothetical protein
MEDHRAHCKDDNEQANREQQPLDCAEVKDDFHGFLISWMNH